MTYMGASGRTAYMSGGIDLMAAMKAGSSFDDVIRLRSVQDWTSIVESEDSIVLGAGVTHQLLADSPVIRKTYPTLCAAWSELANNRVRTKGTLGGNLMARNSAYDFPIAAIAAGAEVRFVDPNLKVVQLPIDQLADVPAQALLTNIVLPRRECMAFAAQFRWKPLIAFAVSFRREAGEVMGRLAVGCGFASPVCSTVRLDHGLFDRLARETPLDIADRFCSLLPRPASDWNASADYRIELLRVLLAREIGRVRSAGPRHEN